MDLYATFAGPVEAIFGRLADPARLGDWLPQVTAAGPVPGPVPGVGLEFPLTVQLDGTASATGEMTAFEPPWLVGYRLFTGSRAVSIRVTCTAQPCGTRIHVHQPDDHAPLTIDLARLNRVLATALPPRPGQ